MGNLSVVGMRGLEEERKRKKRLPDLGATERRGSGKVTGWLGRARRVC